MSLWYCTEHGLVGPGACCSKASRVSMPLLTSDPEEAAYVITEGGAKKDAKLHAFGKRITAIATTTPMRYEGMPEN